MNASFLINNLGSSNDGLKLLIMSGESNSGGFAINSDCSTTELLPRTSLKIYNPYTTTFQTMQIGVNNLLDHPYLTDNASHSWENGLANLAAGSIIKNSTYLVKAGAGGSVIADWNTGGTFANMFNTRVNSALTLRGIINTPKFALLYSQGINDRITTWVPATWVTATIARFNYLRGLYGDFPIVMTKFTSYPDMDTYIDQVCAAVTNCWAIDTTGFDLRDVNHWSYIGQKQVATAMVAKLKAEGYSL